MTDESKRHHREQKAREAIANSETCPLTDLQAAAAVFDSALLLVVQRMCGSLL